MRIPRHKKSEPLHRTKLIVLQVDGEKPKDKPIEFEVGKETFGIKVKQIHKNFATFYVYDENNNLMYNQTLKEYVTF